MIPRMITKNEVKYIQSLSDKKNRDRHNVFVAEGPKIVTELLANGIGAQIIYTTKKITEHERSNFEIKEILLPDLQRLSQFDTPNEMIGVFYKRKLPVFNAGNTFTLALDGIQNPGNMGTIIRTADWFGIRQIVASIDSADCYNSKVVQSTMGSISRVNIYYEELETWLRKAPVPVFGACLNGKSVHKVAKPKEGILVIGNESKGIRSGILPFIHESISIPKIGQAESLNAAVAAGILLSYLLS